MNDGKLTIDLSGVGNDIPTKLGKSRPTLTFESLDEFILWYNDRPHGSLDFENLESPNLAFWRRLPQEAIFGIGIRVFGW